jgi:hypothetical protein
MLTKKSHIRGWGQWANRETLRDAAKDLSLNMLLLDAGSFDAAGRRFAKGLKMGIGI